jgi:hypothetical protein
MLRDLKNNENGLVFVTILMIVAIIMTITIGIISLSVTQVTFSEQEIQRVKTEMLAQGMLAYVFANQVTGVASNAYAFNATIDNLTYVVNASIFGGTPNTNLLIQVNY